MHASTLAMTAVMAAIYLMAVRIVDFNEKEPIWAVLMHFVFGGGAALVLLLAAPPGLLEGVGDYAAMGGIAGVMAKELARFLAIGAGIGVLGAVGRARGYSEINGLMDGVVYGSSGGLGFALGLVLGRSVLGPSAPMGADTAATWGQLALVGLSDGVFGALMGIGFAAALMARTPKGKAGGSFLGFLGAVGAHVCYDYIARGHSLSDSGLLLKWVALLLPLVIVLVVVAVALGGEKRAIAEELGAESATGAVTQDELGVLQSFAKREAIYLKALFSGEIARYATLHGLHNRQVQLALTKRRAAGEQDDELRQSLGGEIAALRASVFELKQRLGLEIPAPETTRSPESGVEPATEPRDGEDDPGDEPADKAAEGGE